MWLWLHNFALTQSDWVNVCLHPGASSATVKATVDPASIKDGVVLSMLAKANSVAMLLLDITLFCSRKLLHVTISVH